MHSSRSNTLYWHDAGPSNPSEQSANDLVTELARLIDQKYGCPRVAHDRYYSPAEHDQGDYFEDPHDEKIYNDTPHKSWRRGLVTALALMVWATVGTAGAYAFRTYYFGPGSTQTSAARSHAKQAQPGAGGGPPAAAASVAAGGYVVQVSAQRSKADAEAFFRSLQKKFPSLLGGRTPIVRRADLGAKGIYYRTMVGPFASAGEADQFCGRFKAAGGGQCIIQRN